MRTPLAAILVLGAGLWTAGCPAPASLPETAAAGAVQAAVAAATTHAAPPARAAGRADTTFAARIARLSEPGGAFDTDNLISNETSYLHVLHALAQRGVRGGAYVGVGPDQNFSYIARTRPDIAFIIDIRRDNLLQHLFFKALFAQADSRIEYLALLTGRPVPRDGRWDGAPITDLVARIDASAVDETAFARAAATVRASVQTWGVPLDDADLATIRRIHEAFARNGLDLRFTSHGRPPQPYYPTLRQLLLETDETGRPGSYLADEAGFRFLKAMQARDAIIPVVGDLAGPHALEAIGREIRSLGLVVSAFYTSNVEYYLMLNGGFAAFARTTAGLPHDGTGVIIRSYFGRGAPHPNRVPGYGSTQLLEPIAAFAGTVARGGYRDYGDLVRRNVLPPVGQAGARAPAPAATR